MELLLDIAKRDKKAYEIAWTYLTKIDSRITIEIIEKHISESEYKHPDNLSHIFKRMIESAKNAQMKRNVIGDIQKLNR